MKSLKSFYKDSHYYVFYRTIFKLVKSEYFD